jgi:adenylate kinase family enzyme
MRKYVIMGVQGSGKGTQSELLCDDLDLVHISVGDIFRCASPTTASRCSCRPTAASATSS